MERLPYYIEIKMQSRGIAQDACDIFLLFLPDAVCVTGIKIAYLQKNKPVGSVLQDNSLRN